MLRLLFVLFFLVQVSCTTGSRLKSASVEDVLFQFSPIENSIEVQQYTYSSNLKFYDDQQLLKEKFQGVDFVTNTQYLNFMDQQKSYNLKISTVSKVGTMGLHSMGFPELSETIEYEINKNYKILNASKQKRGSVFYVPPVPLPHEKVKVGETWLQKYSWIGENNIPLALEVVGVLKSVLQCPKEIGLCSVVEVSGKVFIPESIKTSLKIQSNIRGKYLLENSTSSILWSHVRSEEVFVAEGTRINSTSCIASIRTQPKSYLNKTDNKTLSCDPKNEDIYIP